MAGIRIEGRCDPRFERVKAAFAENFEKRNEYGAAVAVKLAGQPVVDLWAGHTDKARTQAWARDTIANVFSTTKGMTAICAHRLVDQGKLDLDAPVVRYWPEFGQAGKEKMPVRMLLNHQAGLAAIRKKLNDEDMYNWETMASALAAQEPWWTPGTRHGYHALTIGFLVGEVMRRITGKSVGAYFRDEIAGPLGLDCHIGLKAGDDNRCATILASPPPPPDQPADQAPGQQMRPPGPPPGGDRGQMRRGPPPPTTVPPQGATGGDNANAVAANQMAPPPGNEAAPPEDTAAASAAPDTSVPPPPTSAQEQIQQAPTEQRQLREMPENFRANFPAFTVDVHAYNNNPQRRFVLISGKRYHEGDTMAEGPRIVSIVPEGLVLDWQGQQVLYAISH